jgi:hypothetical protein
MISQNNRRNSDFQILYFLVGSCHTPDGAYSLLSDLKEDRQLALSQVKSEDLKKLATIKKNEAIINNPDSKDYEILLAKAELMDLDANKEITQKNIDAGYAELAFIQKCMDKLEPHRKYSHLPLPEAHQAMQQEEWKLELIERAENYLLTSGTIPHDQLSTMRQHPDFNEEITPAIENIRIKIAKGMSLSQTKLEQSKVLAVLEFNK